MVKLITEHMDIWTAAQKQKTNGGRGRGKNSNGQSPHGIKKLRELILELAVRGKLVPQDPNDEPASVLLEKIAKEKARLIKEGEIKNQKTFPEITEDEKSFELPVGWKWMRFQDVSSYIQRGKGPKYADQGKVQVISQKCIQWFGFDLSQARFVDDASLNVYQPERFLKSNDLLWNSTGTGTVGRIIVLGEVEPNRLVADSHVTVIRPLIVNSNFLWCYVAAPGIQLRIEPDHENSLVSGTTKQVELNTSAVQPLLVPVPPLAEQHRIVSKVDELMALCEQLEKQQTDSIASHQTLVETLLATLTSAVDQSEFPEAWPRIANHFGTLFTTEHSIVQLKQTILQLAVMGKLVPQNPNDEPAIILLEKITEEKAQLIKEGKIKKQQPLLEISEDEKPFELPEGWEFVRLERLCKLITKGSSPKWQGVAYTDDPDDVLFVTSENVRSYVLKLDSKKYVEKKFNEVEPRSILGKGDYLMNIVGASIGRTAIYNIDDLANINQAVCLIRAFTHLLNSQYLVNFFNSEVCVSYMFDKQVDNARANLSMGNIAKFVIPFPPLAEQHRIVAKVDELMAICDTMKARLNETQTTQVQLADAIVEQAVV